MKTSTTDTFGSVKDLTEAFTALSTTITRNMIEAQTKTWSEMVKFGETATKLSTDAVKDMPFAKSFVNPWTK
jgi:hypothetical protein